MHKQPPYGQHLVLALTVSLTSIATSVTVQAQARQLSAAEKRLVATEVTERLKDPNAAQFKWPAVTYKPSVPGGAYCGYVNGKNAFGAYVGFTPFIGEVTLRGGRIVSFSTIKIEPTTDDVYGREMRRTTIEMCRVLGVQM